MQVGQKFSHGHGLELLELLELPELLELLESELLLLGHGQSEFPHGVHTFNPGTTSKQHSSCPHAGSQIKLELELELLESLLLELLLGHGRHTFVPGLFGSSKQHSPGLHAGSQIKLELELELLESLLLELLLLGQLSHSSSGLDSEQIIVR